MAANLVTWTLTVSRVNSSSCVQRVIVLDTSAPMITCPADMTVSANAGCAATNVTLGAPVTSDNCSVASVTSNAPASYPLGTKDRKSAVKGTSVDTGSCVQRENELDNRASMITC